MRQIFLIILLFLTTSCGHWSIVDRANQDGSVWVKKGFWWMNDLYYCTPPQAEGKNTVEPKCYQPKYYSW